MRNILEKYHECVLKFHTFFEIHTFFYTFLCPHANLCARASRERARGRRLTSMTDKCKESVRADFTQRGGHWGVSNTATPQKPDGEHRKTSKNSTKHRHRIFSRVTCKKIIFVGLKSQLRKKFLFHRTPHVN